MKETFAKRLRSARQLSTLSMDGLARAMDGIVSKNAIAKYERAEMMPGSRVIIALSRALSVKPDYFFRPFSVEIEQVEFRKKSKLGVKKIKAIKQQVSYQVQRYLEIEGLLNISTQFINPIQAREVVSAQDVENVVCLLLKDWQLGINALPNVLELLEDKHIKVLELDAEEGFDGLSGWAIDDKQRIPFIVVNKNFPIERKRFTALHELGHLVLRFNIVNDHKQIEKYCHQFAGAMLMPYQTFIDEIGEQRNRISLNELISIKESYGISIQAIMARAFHLGVINKPRYVAFRKFISRNRTEESMGKYKGKEHSERFIQLVNRAAAENIISMSKAASLMNKKLASFRDEFVTV